MTSKTSFVSWYFCSKENTRLYNISADVLANMDVSQGKRKSKRKNKKNKLDEDVATAIAQLRSRLLGEEIKEVVTAPVKETMSVGKSLLGMGQRLTSWVTSFIKS